MKKRIIYILLAIIILSNLPPVDFFFEESYAYRNIDGTFKYAEEPGKGSSFKTVMLNYGVFLCRHPDKDLGDNRLFRTFTIKPWRFWEWHEMIFHSDRFGLPYLNPNN